MSQSIYLNIGCGKVKLAGFINIDLEPGGDIQCDITQGLPYEDKTIDGIYSEHFIEHLSQRDNVAFLRECRRVLKPGGRVRIATPDLDELIHQYADNNWRQPWLRQYGYEWICNRAEYLNISMREWGHSWVVNEEELCRLANLAGLESPQRCTLNKSSDSRMTNLETRAESTLIMEFFKRVDVVTENPLVTIVIPAYRPDFLPQCFDSALAQSYRNVEILVLDDSPSTEIEMITSAYARRDPRIVYQRNSPALGEPDNLMKGVHLARGEFIKPLYDDDLLEADAVEKLLNAMRTAPEARLAAGRRLPINAVGNRLNSAILGGRLSCTSGRLSGTTVIERILGSGANLLGEPTCFLFRQKDALAVDEPNLMTLFGRLCFGVGDICLAFHLLSRGDLVYVAETVAKVRVHAGQTQRQSGIRETTLLSLLYLRQQSSRMGLKIPRRSLLINKLLIKYGQVYPIVKTKRRVMYAIRQIFFPD